jgi:hypothetical protein
MRAFRFALASLALAALSVGLFASVAFAAEPFRVRVVKQQGKEVLVYHDHVDKAGAGEVEIQVGPATCVPVSSQVLRPGRGGDGLTTLIVLDRGGTARSGMGQHSEAMRGALKSALEGVVGKIEADRVAIVDASGSDREPRLLKATNKMDDVRAFLDGLPAPSGSGADVFGVGTLGMAELDRAGTPIGAVIVISDGVDPAAEKDANAADTHKQFVATARKRGYPVAAILVSRFSDQRGDGDVKLRNGRNRMAEAADATNGDLRSVNGDDQLQSNLRKELEDLGATFAKVERTVCTLSGKVEDREDAVIDMKVKKGSEVVGQSKSQPAPRLSLAGGDFSVKTDAPAKAQCQLDSNCDAASKCESGKCVPRKTIRNLTPWVGGGLALAGVLLLAIWYARRKARLRQDEEERRRAEAERIKTEAQQKEAERLEQERRDAAARIAALEQAAAKPAVDVEAEIERRINPDVLRLLGTPESTLLVDRALRAGAYLVGAADDVDIRLESPTISGHHAQLVVENGGRASIMDLGSSNGTFVNQVRLQQRQAVELRAGDVIGLSRSVAMQLHPIQAGGPAVAGNRPPATRGRTILEE